MDHLVCYCVEGYRALITFDDVSFGKEKNGNKKFFLKLFCARYFFGKAIQSNESIKKMNGIRRCCGKSMIKLCTFSTK
jgi:hypothetical protein